MWLTGLNLKKKKLNQKTLFNFIIMKVLENKNNNIQKLQNCNLHGKITYGKIRFNYKLNNVYNIEDHKKLSGNILKGHNWFMKERHCQFGYNISFWDRFKIQQYRKVYLSATTSKINEFCENNLDLKYEIFKKMNNSEEEYALCLNTNQAVVIKCDKNFNTQNFIEERKSDMCNDRIFELIKENDLDTIQTLHEGINIFSGNYKEYLNEASVHVKHYPCREKCIECYQFFQGPDGQKFYQFIKELGSIFLEIKGYV